MLFITSNISAYANSDASSCQAHIISRQTAKAIGIDNSRPPSNHWINLQTLPDLIEDHWKGYSGSVWYKIRWNYICSTPNQSPMMLVVNYINMAGQVYINDDLLWQDKSLVEPLSRSWNMPRQWSLPASSLKEGENTIWIRVIGVSSQSSGLGEVLIGTADHVLPKYQIFQNQQRTLMLINLSFTFTLGVVAFFLWFFHRKDSAFGWFSLASLAWALVMTNALLLEAPFGLTTLSMARISIVCFFAYSIFSCFYAWRLAQIKFPRIEKLLYLLSILILALAILTPHRTLDFFIASTFILSCFILITNFLTYPWIAYQTKLLEAYMLAFTFIFFTIVGIHDILIVFYIIYQAAWMPITAPITALMIALILALRLTQNTKKIHNFNKTLTEKVRQAQTELSLSMSTQHQLELKNIKLQERITLAHDLHDGLGGSLVRSIALINQHKENLSNEQFLSILKLLRDDLRQVIDSGSSNGTKIPDTPILWGAPVRHRYIQIFEELEIESVWDFPIAWEYKPNVLECLTLLRVTEEALTNIIKHSHAKNVKVRLSFPHNKNWILEIEDDGIGFNPEIIYQSGISVGIRSMKIRLEKIFASMIIESNRKGTKIIISKNNSLV